MQALLHFRPSEIEVAVAQANVLAGVGIFVELKRRRERRIEYFERVPQDLDGARGHIGVLSTFLAGTHFARHAQHELVAYPIGALETGLDIGVEYDLHDARAVTDIEKDHPAMIAAAVHPAVQLDLFPYVGSVQDTTVVTTHG